MRVVPKYWSNYDLTNPYLTWVTWRVGGNGWFDEWWFVITLESFFFLLKPLFITVPPDIQDWVLSFLSCRPGGPLYEKSKTWHLFLRKVPSKRWDFFSTTEFVYYEEIKWELNRIFIWVSVWCTGWDSMGVQKIMTPMTRWTPPQTDPCPPSLPLSKIGSRITSGVKRRRRRRGLVRINTHYYIHLVTHSEGIDTIRST